jgi:hypothetical protein
VTSTASAKGFPIQHPCDTTGGEVPGGGTTAATNSPVPVPGVTSSALILGILISAPCVASGGKVPGSATEATNSPIPIPGVSATALVLGVVNSAPHVASGGEVPGGGEALILDIATEATNCTILVPGAGAKKSFPGVTLKVVTVPTVAFLFSSEFEGNSNKAEKEMGVSTTSKSKLSASSDVEDQSSYGSVRSVKHRGGKSDKAAKSIVGEQQWKKCSDKAVSEAAGAKQLDAMAVI